MACRRSTAMNCTSCRRESPRRRQHRAIAAGTGLGEALLHNVDGRFVPSPSEGGHSDFPARTEREIDVLRHLVRRFGRASVEHVVSGRGLVNLHEVTHDGPCPALDRRDLPDAPAIISTAALERRCPSCLEALGLFIEAYGAEAGNPRCERWRPAVSLSAAASHEDSAALADGRFLHAFREKAPFEDMLRRMPVKVILNDQVALVGAAICAASL
jgi:glucokinase